VTHARLHLIPRKCCPNCPTAGQPTHIHDHKLLPFHWIVLLPIPVKMPVGVMLYRELLSMRDEKAVERKLDREAQLENAVEPSIAEEGIAACISFFIANR
jgi:hypothetical protein